MSIPFSGCKSRSAGVISAIAKQLRLVNYKPAKQITVQFDPFHEKAVTARQFLFYLSGPKYVKTNPHCVLKANVVCDRSEPLVKIDLDSGEKIVMKCNHLSTLELLQLFNQHVTSLAPPDTSEDDKLVKKGKKTKKR